MPEDVSTRKCKVLLPSDYTSITVITRGVKSGEKKKTQSGGVRRGVGGKREKGEKREKRKKSEKGKKEMQVAGKADAAATIVAIPPAAF
jgi:hypothetical protein